MKTKFIKNINQKIKINFYYWLQENLYSNNGILKCFFKGKLTQSDAIGKESLVTSLFSFDLHRFMLMVTMIVSFVLTFFFKDQFLIILQAVLAACLFDYISNILSNEYMKNIVAYESFILLNNIDSRIQNIKIQIGIDANYGVDHKTLPKVKEISFHEPRDESQHVFINGVNTLAQKEKVLNRKMTKLEYIVFEYEKNIEDVHKLININNINCFPNVYKSLICILNRDPYLLYFTDTYEFVSKFITNFDRIKFWSRMEIGIYSPPILNLGTKFKKNQISDFLIFGTVIVRPIPSSQSILKRDTFISEIELKKLMKYFLTFIEKLLFLISLYLVIKNSQFPLLKGMPNYISTLFIKSNSDNEFIMGISTGILLLFLFLKLKDYYIRKL